MSVWFERELASNFGLRAGYTFRTDRQNSEAVELNRVYGLYTLQRTFADPGVDGIAGNADDGPAFIWWDIPGLAPASLTGAAHRRRRDRRRCGAGLHGDQAHVEPLVAGDELLLQLGSRRALRADPNQERFADDTVTNWNFKVFGTYQAPWGIVATGGAAPVGQLDLARRAGAGAAGAEHHRDRRTGAYEAEPNGAYRTDNVTVFDAKIERRFRFAGRTLSAFVDTFNIANTNAADIGQQASIVGRPTVTLADGSRVQVQGFLRPTAVVPPRMFRFGARFSF